MPTIDDFKARLQGGGARANLFRAIITFPGFAGGDTELTSFLCKAAQLPASVVGNIAVPFRGRNINIAGDRTFEPWTITIINDTDFAVRNAMERWMNAINEHRNNKGLQNPSEYQTDMSVQQMDRQENVIKEVQLFGCFPTNVSAIDLAYDSNDAIEEFTVELQVSYWTSDTTS